MDSVLEAIKIGAYNYLRKPFREEVLLSELDRCYGHLQLKLEKEALNNKLQESKQRFRNIYQFTSVSIWEQNITELITVINKLKKTGGYRFSPVY